MSLKTQRARKSFHELQRFWAKLNEFNETSRGERRGFTFEKKCSIYRLCTTVNGHRLYIDVQAEESNFQTSAPCDQNEDISVLNVF